MHTVVFSGYLAELITLQAERKNQKPEEYVRSFFDGGAMHLEPPARKRVRETEIITSQGAMHRYR